MKQKINNHLIIELFKYIQISIFGIIYVFVALFILVDMLKIDERPAYFVTYVFAYFFDYALTLKYLFKKAHSTAKVIKYIIYIVGFFALNNALFNIFIYVGIHYLISTVLVIGILFPLRFLVNKFFVFK